MLRILIAIILFIIPSLSSSSQITCYSGTKKIYAHKVHDISYDGITLIFTENSTKLVVAYIGKNCILKLDDDDKKDLKGK